MCCTLITDNDEKTLSFVSLGAGTQSSLLAVWVAEKNPIVKDYWDAEIIFADTRGETEETYTFLFDHLIPYLRRFGKEVTIVSRSDMIDEYTQKKGIPTRKYRSCTDKWKIRVIKKRVREKLKEYNIVKRRGKHVVNMLLGITIDEVHRVKDNPIKYIKNVFPLCDVGYTRQDCIDDLAKRDLHPPKSGCFFCPFEVFSRFKKYSEKHNDQFLRVLNMEDNALKYNPKLHIFAKPIREMMKDYKDEEIETCDSGYCFV